ncbi:hypothetical protein CHUAL_009655 [Chamberlinius hualienensis]
MATEDIKVDLNCHQQTILELFDSVSELQYKTAIGRIGVFYEILERLLTTYDLKDHYICGDFNIDLLKAVGHSFVSVVEEAGFKSCISIPTRDAWSAAVKLPPLEILLASRFQWRQFTLDELKKAMQRPKQKKLPEYAMKPLILEPGKVVFIEEFKFWV